MGMGYLGFMGFSTHAWVWQQKCIIYIINKIIYIKKINHYRKRAYTCSFLMVEVWWKWWWWKTSRGGDSASLISKSNL